MLGWEEWKTNRITEEPEEKQKLLTKVLSTYTAENISSSLSEKSKNETILKTCCIWLGEEKSA